MRNAIHGAELTSRGRLLAAVLGAGALLAWGCGEKTEPTGPGGGVDATGEDTEAPDLTEPDAAQGTDATPDPDGEPADVPETADDASSDDATLDPDGDAGPEPDVLDCSTGKAGCPCTSVEQCDSGFCIDTPLGQQCAGYCSGGCGEKFKCTTASGPGGDVVNICVPRYGKVCNPCNANAECEGPGNGGARCVDLGNAGAFCGSACQVDPDCPAGYACQEASDVAGQKSKQCVVKGGGACTCSQSAKMLELATKCFVAAGEEKCEGKRTCLLEAAPGAPAGGGLTNCVAPAPDAELCDGKDNDCDGQTDEATCDDKNPCTDDTCDGGEGCKHLNNKAPCDADGSACTKDDVCLNGKCGTGPTVVCDDKNPCTTDTCDATAGCKFEAADGLPCNADDSECTVSDACKAGKCEAGPKKACEADDQCVEGKCSVLSGKCVYLVKESVPCNDGNPCTASEKCKGEQCLGEAVSCDDLNNCTADSCDPKAGCQHGNLTDACDDKDACTASDACKDGACAGVAFEAKKCDDSNPCTTDSCDTKLGCIHKPATGGGCDDGNSCTAGDSCDAGSCLPGMNSCACSSDADCAKKEDGNLCNGTLFCDKSKVQFECTVNPTTVVKCDTSVNGACQNNACDAATGKCKLTKQPDKLPCDSDGNVCTANDQCWDGLCVAGPVQTCDDKNPCTDDACDPKSGCKFAPNAAVCDFDGNACTEGDACAAGSCVAGKAKVCDDQEYCTKDGCDAATGKCTVAPIAQSCDDQSLCTSGDACGQDAATGKYTCLPGKSALCDDNNVCTKDACDPVTGCKSTVDATLKVPCYTGDPKTKGKGQCKDGTQQCGSDGKLGACAGEVLPDPKGDPCDGVDNDCDGLADKGCAPTAFTARFATGSVSGAGPQYTARAVTGASNVEGTSVGADGKYTAQFGFLAWVKAALGL